MAFQIDFQKEKPSSAQTEFAEFMKPKGNCMNFVALIERYCNTL